MTRSDVGRGHPGVLPGHGRAARRRDPGACYVNQFGNPANPLAHERSTGPEIWAQMEHASMPSSAASASGGTLTGLTLFRAREPAYRDGARRSGRLGARRVRRNRQSRRGRLVGRRRHRRRFRAADRRSVARSARRTRSPTPRASLRRANCCASSASSRAPLPARWWPRRCAIAASSPRPKRVVTFVLRQRQQVSLQDVQRLLDGRTRALSAAAARRPCAT